MAGAAVGGAAERPDAGRGAAAAEPAGPQPAAEQGGGSPPASPRVTELGRVGSMKARLKDMPSEEDRFRIRRAAVKSLLSLPLLHL